MADSINKILNKKKWTGEEVGRALLQSLVHDAKMKDKPHEPLFSQAELSTMEQSIYQGKDRIAYAVYQTLYSSLVDAYNKIQGAQQSYYANYFRYSHHLTNAMTAEAVEEGLRKLPFIMTQGQYDRLAHSVGADKGMNRAKLTEIIFTSLNYYLIDGINKRPPAVDAALQATRTEPVTNPRILAHYNEDTGNGYYTLEDGRRSDKMPHEKWQKALYERYEPNETLQEHNERRMLWTYELLFKGLEAIKAACNERGISLPDGMTEADAIAGLERMLQGEEGPVALEALINGRKWATWHTYETHPEGLTKYDILFSMLGRYSGEHKDDISPKEQYKEFINDYPELHKAIMKELEDRIGPPIEDKYFNTWLDLAKLGLPAYQELMRVYDEEIIELHLKGKEHRYGGIAIIQHPNDINLDYNGKYVETVDILQGLNGLDRMAADEALTDELEDIFHKQLRPSMKTVYAYNTLIDIIGQAYSIEGAEALKIDTTTMETQAGGFNRLLYMLHGDMSGPEEAKKNKRAILKKLLHPILIEQAQPSPADIEAVKGQIKELGLTEQAYKQLRNLDGFIATLAGKGGV